MEVKEIVRAIERTQNRYLTPDQTLDYLGGISKTTLWRWVNEYGLPQVKVTGVTLYDRKDLDEFLKGYKL